MRAFDYQRIVIGYHGCDAEVRDSVIRHGTGLTASQNEYDWLGRGIYFWEHGPERALEWAKEGRTRGKIQNPAVLGAVLHLGYCFDLLDSAFTDVLERSFPRFCKFTKDDGRIIPKNHPRNEDDPDKLLRELDCAMINWTIDQLELSSEASFHSVRGVFQEGSPAYPGSEIHRRSHIQIAVREPTCILGYFLPSSDGR